LRAQELSPLELEAINFDQNIQVIMIRENIILVWPKRVQFKANSELQIKSLVLLADKLDQIYEFLRSVSGNDPKMRRKKSTRLIFKWDEANPADYYIHFNEHEEKRYIGLRKITTESKINIDWLGWLIHEISHDFIFQNPELEKEVYVEGLCDFFKYRTLIELGYHKKAKILRDKYLKNLADKYHGVAAQFILCMEQNGFTSTKEFINFLKKKNNWYKVVGFPLWQFTEKNSLTMEYFTHLTAQELKVWLETKKKNNYYKDLQLLYELKDLLHRFKLNPTSITRQMISDFELNALNLTQEKHLLSLSEITAWMRFTLNAKTKEFVGLESQHVKLNVLIQDTIKKLLINKLPVECDVLNKLGALIKNQ
jgi:hypothetical protein